jgi:hypothetical protein
MAKDILIASAYTATVLGTIISVSFALHYLNIKSPISVFSDDMNENIDLVLDQSNKESVAEFMNETNITQIDNIASDNIELNNTEKDPQQELIEIQSIIERSIVLDAKNVQQCRLLPMGNSECGGPSFYYVYSVLGENESDLLELSKEYRSLDKSLKQESQIMAICMISPEPRVIIRDGKCSILSVQ